jgi:hypothetical protein
MHPTDRERQGCGCCGLEIWIVALVLSSHTPLNVK